MTTVRFTSTDKLKELQSKIYLTTKQELSQQEILEIAVNLASDNFEELVEVVLRGHKKFTKKEITTVFDMVSDWGEGTENSSTNVDDIVYS